MRPAVSTPLPGPKAKELLERGQAVLSPSYVRPYPFVPVRGQGVFLEDVDGNVFLDFMAGIAVNTTGYAHPKVVEAVRAQAERFAHVCFSDFTHEPTLSLAERLVSKLGGGYRVFFGNSGTEGIEAAIKLVRHHTGRPYLLAFTGAFHGRSLGALSLTASKSAYRKGFAPLLPGVVHVPFPNPFRPPLGARPEDVGEAVLAHLEHLFRTVVPPEEVAAFFLEPIQGEGGYLVPPPGFVPRLKALLERHGILLVADEVQSGAGRTGRFLALEHEGVEADVYVLAKGLASGYPLSALLFREELASWRPGAHGTTFGGQAVAAAAAHATLDLLEGGLTENAARVGAFLLQGLRELQTRFPFLGDVRGRGLMIGLDFGTPGEERPDLRDKAVGLAFQKGLLLLPAGPAAIRIAPPLILTKEEATMGLEILEAVFRQL
ncbi:acetyl ornithine aminotransferase family protein [Thermus thermamylovorans]|uniref:Acetyl ornithine aminotransferase family protein n=1 Tax=Thermus thermamylovorans TaxID=2509362 RepID=A0A4Q9B9B2_9DEIN|nr:acetyl ornithine aminotransferase family protein [Thermus thermamylovorans]TBH21928.1 acetyl ornithine aminotransferase family protein [Thermus thermamylovorans]